MKLKHRNPAIYVGLLGALSISAALAGTPAVAAADDTAQLAEVTDRSNHADGWTNESGQWQYYANGRVRKNAWLVTGVRPGATADTGLERYWLDAEGNLAVGRLIDPKSETDGGSGYYAYATDDGTVVRGLWKNDIKGSSDNGNVYLADNDGRLENPGWVVTDDFGQGLQRYYIDAEEHSAVPGYSEDGWGHYTRPEGYVVRGKFDTGAGTVVLADNDGRTATGSGWLVTNKYDGELQRYYLNGKGAARSSYFYVGNERYFGLGGEGYVLRGAGVGVDGARLYADNDGKLARSEWVVTDQLGQGLQRYWFDSNGAMTHDRLITPEKDGSSWLSYATSEGYVLRGASTEGGVKRYADNDGRLSNGWVITGAFTNGALERYWQQDGQFVTNKLIDAGSGWFAYAKDSAAVVRGKFTVDGKTYLANNDGRLESPGWVITDKYDNGMERYYIDADEHAAVEGFSNDGWAHYTTSDGTVLRGTLKTNNGLLIADNDGKLLEVTHEAGWSDDYYLNEVDGHLYAATGFFNASLDGKTYTFYADETTGKVLRGKKATSNGVLVADENGILAENYTGAGWCVTDRFDGGAQRYYFQSANGHLYARTGLFEEASLSKPGERRQYYGLTDEGYLLINGTRVINGTTYKANEHGELTAVASRTRDPYINTVTWSADWGYLDEMRQYANQYGSPTNYFCVVDYDLCRVIIFQKNGSSWTPIKTWNCNAGTYTRGGIWHIVHKNICMWDDSWFNRMDNNWASCFVEAYTPTDPSGHYRYYPGKGYENCQSFHSSSYTTTGYKNPGCVSIPEQNAKWIYDNCPVGTSVFVLR